MKSSSSILKDYKEVLDSASKNNLPPKINAISFPKLNVFEELHDRGYLKAINCSNLSGKEYIGVEITLSGRFLLESIERELYKKSPKHRLSTFITKFLGWISSVGTAVLISWLITQMK